jgi:hypothetical protein
MYYKITNEQLKRIAKGDVNDHLDASKIEMATELLALRKKNATIINMCENPDNRSSHTLLEMCAVLDKIRRVAKGGE